MQTSLNTTQQGSWYRKVHQGITKLEQEAKAWNIALSGQRRIGVEFQGWRTADF